ncbi:MAG: lytic murein transglycosylase B [Zoogloea sp.]|nr:lytic murein transglycosylase B [Zoogloea sp.]
MSIRSRIALNTLFATLLASALPANAADSFAERPAIQQFIQDMKARYGFDQDALELIFQRAHPIPAVLKAIAPPKTPGVRSWQRYRSRFVEPIRIQAGIRFWEDNAETVRAASARFGVPPEIIVSIIGVETIYGRNTGNFQTVSALATLAFDYPRRAELFRGELEELLLMAREQQRDPLDFQGSYAGALGLPQFLPSSVRKYAVDFDGDGQIDLTNSPGDAIGSVANYLHEHGWVQGAPVAAPAEIGEGADLKPLLAADILPSFDRETLAQHGVRNAGKAQPADKAALVELVTPGAEPEYWLGYQNFYVISRYNRSSFYAMAVFELAEALRGERAARIGWN